LLNVSESLDQTLTDMHRVLRREGWVVIVEPWLTPSLRLVHLLCEIRPARGISRKVSALAEMIHYERATYDQWLAHPGSIASAARKYFSVIHESFAWGKWNFVGMPR
jgi:hypothetical protein